MSSLAGLEKLKTEKPEVLDQCQAAAGLSLGEYTALVFAGALSVEDALKLVKVRAEAMQQASDSSNVRRGRDRRKPWRAPSCVREPPMCRTLMPTAPSPPC